MSDRRRADATECPKCGETAFVPRRADTVAPTIRRCIECGHTEPAETVGHGPMPTAPEPDKAATAATKVRKWIGRKRSSPTT